MKPDLTLKFKNLAKRNAERRTDPRFLKTMGFLTAKGFLGYNRALKENPNARISLEDAIWAGENVEPRILEVLPAAFARLPKHFTFNRTPTLGAKRLMETAEALRMGEPAGEPFLGVSFEKARVWMNLRLRDRRTRTAEDKKLPKNFRLHPDAAERLKKLARATDKTETEILEKLIFDATLGGNGEF